jgi:hypothetical protein
MSSEPAHVDQIIGKTVEYLERPSVVGFEGPFFAHLARDFAALGCEVEHHEKLLSVSRGPSRAEILSCHIDRHGLVSTGHGEFEYAAFVASADDDGEDVTASRSMLRKICDRFFGEPVRAYAPGNGEILARGEVEHAYFCPHRDNLVFRVPGFEVLPVGTPASFHRPCQIDSRRLTGQLDNAISAAFTYALFESGFAGRALFTAEEEIGKSWSHALAFLEEHRLHTCELLVLDTSPFPDEAAIDEGRVVLRNRDAHGEFNPELVSRLEFLCQEQVIPYQMKDEWIASQNLDRMKSGRKPVGLGSTELGRLVSSTQGAVNGATLQCPTFGYHSNRETTSRRAISQVWRLLSSLLLSKRGRDGPELRA